MERSLPVHLIEDIACPVITGAAAGVRDMIQPERFCGYQIECGLCKIDCIRWNGNLIVNNGQFIFPFAPLKQFEGFSLAKDPRSSDKVIPVTEIPNHLFPQ